MTCRFVLATANPHKASEIGAILSGAAVELVPRPLHVPEVDETGATLEENARLKADALVAATGMAAIADDTGLMVDALDGAPGIYSARYAGEDATYQDNVEKLLAALADLPDHGGARRARFVTVAVAVAPGGRSWSATGVVEGRIAQEPAGLDGFGYDPVFVPDDGDGRTFAQMSAEHKHRISHRGRAFRALAHQLAATEPAPDGPAPCRDP